MTDLEIVANKTVEPVDPKDLKIAELNNIIAMLMDYKTNFMGKLCDIRGVKTPCRNCGGLGVQFYNDASSWRHLPGFPPRTTKDVCEHCWGSGDSENIWGKQMLEQPTVYKAEAYNPAFQCEAGGNQFSCDASGIIDAEVVKEAKDIG